MRDGGLIPLTGRVILPGLHLNPAPQRDQPQRVAVERVAVLQVIMRGLPYRRIFCYHTIACAMAQSYR